MGRCILRFDPIRIRNKKSDNDHADNDWLSVCWCVDHQDGRPPDRVEQTVSLVKPDGDPVLNTGDVLRAVEQSVPCTDGDIVTAFFTVTNLGSAKWEDQAEAASRITQQLSRAVADIYLDVAQVVLEYLPFFSANPTAIAAADVIEQALDKLHGPLLDLLDTTFEKVVTPLIGAIADEAANLLGHPNCNGEVLHDVAAFVPTTADFRHITSTRAYQGPQKNSFCGEPPHTEIDLTQDRDLDVFVGTFGAWTPGQRPVWLYAVKRNGDMLWYRQDSISSSWQGPRQVGNGWQSFRQVLPAGGNSFYAIAPDGTLQWYRHDGFNDGSFEWHGPVEVGSGWQNFQRIFGGSDGVLYAVQEDGTLLWYRNYAYASGGIAWDGPRTVGSGWAGFRSVFSVGEGIVYGVQPDGTLLWYRHHGFADGGAAWSGPKTVGSAWNQFRDVVPVGVGVIVAIKPDGSLWWYRHVDYETGVTLSPVRNKFGSEFAPAWEGPAQIGSGWQGYLAVLALLPAAAAAPA